MTATTASRGDGRGADVLWCCSIIRSTGKTIRKSRKVPSAGGGWEYGSDCDDGWGSGSDGEEGKEQKEKHCENGHDATP